MTDFKVVVLSGSTKFESTFRRVEEQLTLEGFIVLTCHVFRKVKGPSLTKEQMNMLDELHQAQIRMADFMFVIDPDGYIGSSTKSEIEYAHGLGKPIAFLEEPNSEDFKGVELANGLGTFNLYNR